MFDRIKRAILARQIADFLGAVPGAIRSHLNTAELARIAAAALLSGGGVWGVLEALAKSLPQWVAPADVGLATGGFILLLEVARRLGHGDEVEPPARLSHARGDEVEPGPSEGPAGLDERLTIDPDVSRVSPVVRGTRVTAQEVVSLVVDGWTWSDILRTHPELTEADIRACLAHGQSQV